MKIINHGKWSIYVPEHPHPQAPPNTAYAKNSKNEDWYYYILPDSYKFQKGSVVATVIENYGGLAVGAAVYEADRLFPDNGYIIEIIGYRGNNPQKEFGSKYFNFDDLTFSKETVTQRVIREVKEAEQTEKS